ncbi:MAG: DoxX family protein [Myxococcota bacterium]
MLTTLGRLFVSLSFVAVGVTHFTDPEPFLTIMPPALPWHLALVYISGFFEVVGGLGLLLPATRRYAGWGLIALLVAVFPANIHMLVNEVYIGDMPQEKWLLWARMPFQLVFALGVLWAGEIWPRPQNTNP